MSLSYAGIFLFALVGFFVSWYIDFKKRRQERMICVIGTDCDKVVHSAYNTTFGIHNETLGMLYYGSVIGGMVLIVLGIGAVGPISLLLFLRAIGAVAAFFSVLLLYVQAAVLKEWCEYCIASAIFCIAIFVLEIW